MPLPRAGSRVDSESWRWSPAASAAGDQHTALREGVAALAGGQLVQRGLHGLQRRDDRLGAVQHGRQELLSRCSRRSPCTTLSSIGYAVMWPWLTKSSICWFTGLLVDVPLIAGIRPAALMIFGGLRGRHEVEELGVLRLVLGE